MSYNPINNPLALTMIVDIVVTIIVDKNRGLLDFSITSNFWVHILNFPIWVVFIVFFVCKVLRDIFYSSWFGLVWFYLTTSKRKRHMASELHELSQFNPRLNTDVAVVSGVDVRSTTTPTSANTWNERVA